MIRSLWHRIRETLAPSSADARIAEEMRSHIEMATERNIAAGMDPAKARREALVAFGGVTRFADDARDAIRHRPLENALQDLRLAIRRMRQRPAFAAAITLTLALGLGATTTVFSIVYGLLLKPLPYPNDDQLVNIQQHWAGQRNSLLSFSPAEYFDYADRLKAFSAFGVYGIDQGDLGGSEAPERVPFAVTSAGAIAALDVHPILGRTITAADDVHGQDFEVLLTGELWRRRYGSSPNVIGQSLLLDGVSYTIIGVLPVGFRFPLDMASTTPAQLVFPGGLDRSAVLIRGSHHLAGIGRVRAGTTIAAAAEDVASVARDFGQHFPADYPPATQFTTEVTSLKESIIGTSRPALLLLLMASACLLAIACVNAASLLLAQAESRRQEMAVRRALGAAAGRLVRQLLVESLLLAALAGSIGIALAALAIQFLAHAHPFDLPRMSTLQLNGPSVVFGLLVTVIAAVAFGFAPALRLAGADLQERLRESGRGSSAGAAERNGRRALIVAEITIACVLLVSASLLTVSFRRLLAVDPGFVVTHVLTTPIRIGSRTGNYGSDTAVTQLVQQLNARIAAIPGVTAAGAVAGVPLVAPRGDIGIEIEGRPIPAGELKPQVNWQVITPGYLEAIGMHLRAGRSIDASDLVDHPGAVVINEAMAAKFWPGESPLGRRFTLGGGAGPITPMVVGVVGNVRQGSLGETPVPEMYFAHAQFRFWGGGGILRSLNLVVRTSGDARSIVPALRREIAAIAPSLPVGDMRTLEDVRSQSVAMPRFMMLLLLSVATVALVIAIVGLYALVAHSVVVRRKEFGIRMALGAERKNVIWLVTREGAWLTAAGLLVGIPTALAFASLLQQFLFDVRPADPAILAGVGATLAVVAMAAAYLPARRAAGTMPVVALRGE